MRVGVMGGGQLARMLLEDASRLGIEATILAEHADDGAAKEASRVLLGAATDETALRRLAHEVDVITLDHELVDLEMLEELEASGVIIRPSPHALRCAVDKIEMRTTLDEANLPMPAYGIITTSDPTDVAPLGERLGWPLVIKAARGGYDGRGVFVVDDAKRAQTVVDELHAAGIDVLVEEKVAIDHELAALVVRRPGGQSASWPAVETAQVGGVCREVLVPGSLDGALAAQAEALAITIADLLGVVGILAVELFVTNGRLVINELAMRPHNSGHWTQDGSVTSQFENHLRAVLDLPLGSTRVTADHVASVNVFGSDDVSDFDHALADSLVIPDAKLHLYGKSPRPGRKLGHVNVAGADGPTVRRHAWMAALALGTPMPPEMEEL